MDYDIPLRPAALNVIQITKQLVLYLAIPIFPLLWIYMFTLAMMRKNDASRIGGKISKEEKIFVFKNK